MHDDAGRLVDDQKEIILEQDAEGDVFVHHRLPRRRRRQDYSHHVADRGTSRYPPDHPPVHRHLSAFNPRLNPRTAGRPHIRQMASEDQVDAQARIAAIGR